QKAVRQLILKIRLMNGFNPYPKIFSNQLPLIVEKNSLIGKVLVIRMILIFISQTQERLPNGD
ncbi:integrase, partial [Enterococcus faecium]